MRQETQSKIHVAVICDNNKNYSHFNGLLFNEHYLNSTEKKVQLSVSYDRMELCKLLDKWVEIRQR